MTGRTLTFAQLAILAQCEFWLKAYGLADRFHLTERVDPEALPPEVVFIDDARAKRDAQASVREARL